MNNYFVVLHETTQSTSASLLTGDPTTTEAQILERILQEKEGGFDAERESLTVIQLNAFTPAPLLKTYIEFKQGNPASFNWSNYIQVLTARAQNEKETSLASKRWVEVAAAALIASEGNQVTHCPLCDARITTLHEAIDFHGHVFEVACHDCIARINSMRTWLIVLFGGMVNKDEIVIASPRRSCHIQSVVHAAHLVLDSDTPCDPFLAQLRARACDAARSFLPELPSHIKFYRDYETPENKAAKGKSTPFAILTNTLEEGSYESIAPLEHEHGAGGPYVGDWQISEANLATNCEEILPTEYGTAIPFSLWQRAAMG